MAAPEERKKRQGQPLAAYAAGAVAAVSLAAGIVLSIRGSGDKKNDAATAKDANNKASKAAATRVVRRSVAATSPSAPSPRGSKKAQTGGTSLSARVNAARAGQQAAEALGPDCAVASATGSAPPIGPKGDDLAQQGVTREARSPTAARTPAQACSISSKAATAAASTLLTPVARPEGTADPVPPPSAAAELPGMAGSAEAVPPRLTPSSPITPIAPASGPGRVPTVPEPVVGTSSATAPACAGTGAASTTAVVSEAEPAQPEWVSARGASGALVPGASLQASDPRAAAGAGADHGSAAPSAHAANGLQEPDADSAAPGAITPAPLKPGVAQAGEAGPQDRKAGAPAEEAGAPAAEAGAQAEEAGAPAEEGGAPAEEGRAPAEEGRAQVEEAGAQAEEGGKKAEPAGDRAAQSGMQAEESRALAGQAGEKPVTAAVASGGQRQGGTSQVATTGQSEHEQGPAAARAAAGNGGEAPGAEDAGDEAAQTEAEIQAEALLQAATAAWNVQGARQQGARLARQALEALRAGNHRAKYRAEVCSSLADMLYALNRWEEALGAVGEAVEAAREAGEWSLVVKLSNNMGAVYKKLGRPDDAEALHRSTYSLALGQLGAGHPLTLLARSNLVEALVGRSMAGAGRAQGQGQAEAAEEQATGAEAEEAAAGQAAGDSPAARAAREEARQLLQAALAELSAQAQAEAQVLGGGAAGGGNEGASAGRPTDAPETPEAAALRRTRTALIRTHIELGRLEMVAGESPDAAEGAYRSALALCREVYGAGSREAAAPAFNLANCLRAIGKKDEARVLYAELLDQLLARGGAGEETAVHLARALADLAEEADDWASADRYASRALESMTLLIGTRAHPVLESFYQAACRAKTNNGDVAGAEALRKQFLSGMLRLTQQQARHGAGRGAAAAAPASRKGAKKAARK